MAARIASKAACCCGIERVRRAHGRRAGFASGSARQRQHPFARQRRAAAPALCTMRFELLEVVRAGMQRREKPAARARLSAACPRLGAGQLDAQSLPRARGADRARSAHASAAMKPLRSSDANDFVGERELFRQIRRRERPAFEHAQHPQPLDLPAAASSSSWRAASQTGVGERIDLAAPDFAAERQHGAQHLAERRAIIAGDPSAEGQQFGVQHRLGIDQPQRVARGTSGGSSWHAQRNAGHFARRRTERARGSPASRGAAASRASE